MYFTQTVSGDIGFNQIQGTHLVNPLISSGSVIFTGIPQLSTPDGLMYADTPLKLTTSGGTAQNIYSGGFLASSSIGSTSGLLPSLGIYTEGNIITAANINSSGVVSASSGYIKDRIGIGRTATQAGLNVSGDAQIAYLEGMTQVFLGFYPRTVPSGRSAYMGFAGNGTANFSLINEISSGNLIMGSSGTPSIQIDPSGHLAPFQTGLYDLGRPDLHYRKIYVDSIIGTWNTGFSQYPVVYINSAGSLATEFSTSGQMTYGTGFTGTDDSGLVIHKRGSSVTSVMRGLHIISNHIDNNVGHFGASGDPGASSNAITAFAYVSGSANFINGHVVGVESFVHHAGTSGLGALYGFNTFLFNDSSGSISDVYGLNVNFAGIAGKTQTRVKGILLQDCAGMGSESSYAIYSGNGPIRFGARTDSTTLYAGAEGYSIAGPTIVSRGADATGLGQVHLISSDAFASGMGGKISLAGAYQSSGYATFAVLQGQKADATSGSFVGNLVAKVQTGGAIVEAFKIFGADRSFSFISGGVFGNTITVSGNINSYSAFTSGLGNIMVRSTDTAASGIGGQIGFGGRYTSGGTFATFGSVGAVKAVSGDGDFTGDVVSWVNTGGGGVVEVLRLKGSNKFGAFAAGATFASGITVSGTISALTTQGSGAPAVGILSLSDTTSLNQDNGGAVSLSYIYTGTTQAVGAAIKTGKDNATSGVYAGYLSFWSQPGTSLTEGMRLTSAGRLGVNVKAPLQRLQVSGSIVLGNDAGSSALNNAYFLFNVGDGTWGVNNYAWTMASRNSRLRILGVVPDGSDFGFATHATGVTPSGQGSFTEKLTLRGDTGYVGLATSTPLHQLEFAASTTTSGGIGFSTDVELYRGAVGEFRVRPNSTDILISTSGGNTLVSSTIASGTFTSTGSGLFQDQVVVVGNLRVSGSTIALPNTPYNSTTPTSGILALDSNGILKRVSLGTSLVYTSGTNSFDVTTPTLHQVTTAGSATNNIITVGGITVSGVETIVSAFSSGQGNLIIRSTDPITSGIGGQITLGGVFTSGGSGAVFAVLGGYKSTSGEADATGDFVVLNSNSSAVNSETFRLRGTDKFAVFASGATFAGNITTSGTITARSTQGSGAPATGILTLADTTALNVDNGAALTMSYVYTGTTQAVGAALKVGKDNATSGVYGGYLGFWYQPGTSLTEGMRLTSAGRLGINAKSPLQRLMVSGSVVLGNDAGTSSLNNAYFIFNTGDNTWGTNVYALTMGSKNSRFRALTVTPDTADFAYSTHVGSSAPTGQASFTERFTIKGDLGYVGIGTSLPTHALEFAAATTTSGGIGFGTDVDFYRGAAGQFNLRPGFVNTLISTSGGTTLIGSNTSSGSFTVTTSASIATDLRVSGSTVALTAIPYNTTTPSSGFLALDSTGTVKRVLLGSNLSYNSGTNSIDAATGSVSESDPLSLHTSGGSNTMNQSILFGSSKTYDIGNISSLARTVYSSNIFLVPVSGGSTVTQYNDSSGNACGVMLSYSSGTVALQSFDHTSVDASNLVTIVAPTVFLEGGVRYNIETNTVTNSISSTNGITFVNSIGPTTQTLPNAALHQGKVTTIKNINTGTITVDSFGGTVEAASADTLTALQSGTYASDGVNWWKI